MYKNETDRPMKAKQGGHPMNDYGCMDFKKEAFDQAYGQAGKSGVMDDMRKIHSQHMHSYSDDHSGKEA
jgi:hypothetical protein